MPTSMVWPKSCGFVLQAATEERLQSAVVSIWPIWACYEAKDSFLAFSFAHTSFFQHGPVSGLFGWVKKKKKFYSFYIDIMNKFSYSVFNETGKQTPPKGEQP